MPFQHSAPTVIVPAIKAAVFGGASAGTFTVTDIAADDRILYVQSHDSFVNALSGTSGEIQPPIIGLGDAYNAGRSSSSASVVAAGVVGLDYSTASFHNVVYYIDVDATA